MQTTQTQSIANVALQTNDEATARIGTSDSIRVLTPDEAMSVGGGIAVNLSDIGIIPTDK